MEVSILYHPNSDHEREVLTFERDFKRRTGHDVKLISLETVEGSEQAKLYDAVQYPAVLAKDNEGKLLKMWQGLPLPLFDDIQAYASNSPL